MVFASVVVLALSSVLAWVVTCMLSPLLVAVHEAGHAALALALVPGRVVVEVGQGECAWHVERGRLHVAFLLRPHRPRLWWRWITPGGLYFKPVGRIRPVRAPSPWHGILVVLGGPAASLGLAALCVVPTTALWHDMQRLLATYGSSHDVVWALRYFTLLPWLAVYGVTAVLSAIVGLANLWPYQLPPAAARRHGIPGTDGWMILHHLQEARRHGARARRFDHFTPRMRRVFTYAHQAALERGHGAITPHHLLLGVLRESDATAVRVLHALHVDIAQLQTRVDEALAGLETAASLSGLAPETKAIIERMVDEARRGGDDVVGTEHALLALLAEGDGAAAQTLARHGVVLEEARAAVAARLAGAHAQDPA